MKTTLNSAQSLYTFDHGEFVTTRGFEALFKETNALAKRLHKPEYAVSDKEYGTKLVCHKHNALIEIAREKNLGMWFHPDTPRPVRKVLNEAFKHGFSIRIFYGDTVTGKDWLEECDVLGSIHQSSGILKVPILIDAGSIGGPSILDHCIVRIVDVTTGQELYCHHNYHHGVFTLHEYYECNYEAEIRVDGETHARFKSMDDAYHWMAFMVGKSFLKTCE
jgi:hypothetical protein